VQLRDYQISALTELRAHHAERCILCLPTGSGKTVIAAELIRRAICKGSRVLFVVHRRELVMQAVARLAALDVASGVILANEPTNPHERVQVASIQTLARRDKPPANILVVDECQHATAKTWRDLIDHYGECMLVGLTATPWRLSGKPLGDLFGKIIAPVTTRQLCEEGVLIEPRVFAPPGPNLKGVRSVGGDFASDQLAERMKTLTGNIIEHWRRHANGRKTIAFTVNVEHSRDIAARFADVGVASAHLDGTTPREQRDDVLAQLANGRVTVLSNCMILGEGWDLPSLEVAILARPTKSLSLHLQQIGRIMRACPGKEGALVLDHADNHRRHGMVTDERVWSLDEPAPKTSDGGVSTCPKCWAVMPVGAVVCPECGYVREQEIAEPTDITETDEQLVELSKVDRRKEYAAIIARANLYGCRIGWARYQFKARFGSWPRKMRDIEAAYVCKSHEPTVKDYGYVRKTVCAQCLREVDSNGNLAGVR